MPDSQPHRYSLETQGVLLDRIDKNMVTKSELQSLERLLTTNQNNADKKIADLETKLSRETTKLHGRIDQISKDNVELEAVKVNSRRTLIGAVAVAVLSLTGTIITVVFGGG